MSDHEEIVKALRQFRRVFGPGGGGRVGPSIEEIEEWAQTSARAADYIEQQHQEIERLRSAFDRYVRADAQALGEPS